VQQQAKAAEGSFMLAEVKAIIEAVVGGVQAALNENLRGIYLKGSLALGDFNPETSDVDLLVVVKQPLNQGDFERLDQAHRQIQTLPNRYANEVELAYVPAAVLNNFVPGLKYPALERGEGLKWKTLGSNWLIEFWTVREHGVVLYGPDPKTLIDPIAKAQIVAAVLATLPDWTQWTDTWDDAFQTHMGELRFSVETMCRVLHTLNSGEVCSKPKAVAWALANLPQPWVSLVKDSQNWKNQMADAVSINSTWQFVRWVVDGNRLSNS
jgi:predicted nucleotidyltransferase